MKSKKIFFVLFGLIVLFIPFYIIMSSEDVLENGHQHKFRLQGYDPFDPFRGKYLRINYDRSMPCAADVKEGDEAFVTFEKDEMDFSSFAYASHEKPTHDDYIIAEVIYVRDGEATIKVDNMSKYFINEDKAKQGENVLLEFRRNRPDDIYVAIRVLDGEARLEDIFVEETPLLEYLESH